MTHRIEASPLNQSVIERMSNDKGLRGVAEAFLEKSIAYNYSYNFTWLGRPIIQYPQDIVALQEIVWKTKPDVILEAGIAHGGSLIFFASILELIGGTGKVLGVDIDIREHNRVEIERHKLSSRITLFQGSSIDPSIVSKVRDHIRGTDRVMVVLDSNHSADHVLGELRAYSPLVTSGCYLAVMDTIVDQLPAELLSDRSWGPGDSPMTAVDRFLKENSDFVVDEEYNRKLLITVAPRGYLRRN